MQQNDKSLANGCCPPARRQLGVAMQLLGAANTAVYTKYGQAGRCGKGTRAARPLGVVGVVGAGGGLQLQSLLRSVLQL